MHDPLELYIIRLPGLEPTRDNVAKLYELLRGRVSMPIVGGSPYSTGRDVIVIADYTNEKEIVAVMAGIREQLAPAATYERAVSIDSMLETASRS